MLERPDLREMRHREHVLGYNGGSHDRTLPDEIVVRCHRVIPISCGTALIRATRHRRIIRYCITCV
jgi:hypothetical protein